MFTRVSGGLLLASRHPRAIRQFLEVQGSNPGGAIFIRCSCPLKRKRFISILRIKKFLGGLRPPRPPAGPPTRPLTRPRSLRSRRPLRGLLTTTSEATRTLYPGRVLTLRIVLRFFEERLVWMIFVRRKRENVMILMIFMTWLTTQVVVGGTRHCRRWDGSGCLIRTRTMFRVTRTCEWPSSEKSQSRVWVAIRHGNHRCLLAEQLAIREKEDVFCAKDRASRSDVYVLVGSPSAKPAGESAKQTIF